MDDLEIRLSLQYGRLVFELVGELNARTAPELDEVLALVGESTNLDMVIDLTGLDAIEATGVSVLAHAAGTVEGTSRSMRLRSPQPRVRRLLDIAGLSTRVPLEG